MALIFEGITKCSLCNEVINDADNVIGYSAFLPKEHHLWRYSDSAFHISCFKNWKFRDEFQGLYSEVRELDKFKPKIPEGMSWIEFEKTEQYKNFVEMQMKLQNDMASRSIEK